MAELPADAYAWLTPPVHAALALVDVPAREDLLDRPLPAPGHARFALLVGPAGDPADEVVATRIAADRLELSCHGGVGVRAAVDACLAAHGLTPVPAPLDDRWGRLASAPCPAVLRWLCAHPDPAAVPPFPAAFLTRHPRILLTGPVNAGKSTLLNAWCGRSRARVAPEPGTTRDLVTATAEHRGWRLRLTDSAGLRAAPTDPVERAGQDLVRAARAAADLVVHLDPFGPRPASTSDPDPNRDPDHSVIRPHPGDLVVRSKADLDPAGAAAAVLPWSSPAHIGDAAAETLLAALADAVFAALGIPVSTKEQGKTGDRRAGRRPRRAPGE